MSVPGSRRWKAKAAGAITFPQWHEGIPAGLEEVGIDFYCKRGHQALLLASFRISTDDNSEARDGRLLKMRCLDGQRLPEQHEGDHLRIRFRCPSCGADRQVTPAKMREAVLALWEPHGMRVVTYWI